MENLKVVTTGYATAFFNCITYLERTTNIVVVAVIEVYVCTCFGETNVSFFCQKEKWLLCNRAICWTNLIFCGVLDVFFFLSLLCYVIFFIISKTINKANYSGNNFDNLFDILYLFHVFYFYFVLCLIVHARGVQTPVCWQVVARQQLVSENTFIMALPLFSSK